VHEHPVELPELLGHRLAFLGREVREGRLEEAVVLLIDVHRIERRELSHEPRYLGARSRISRRERIGRLDELVSKLRDSTAARTSSEQPDFTRSLVVRWPAVADSLRSKAGTDQCASLRDRFLQELGECRETDYIKAIQNQSSQTKAAATAWLKSEVDAIAGSCP
jgi:hypothetical protein